MTKPTTVVGQARPRRRARWSTWIVPLVAVATLAAACGSDDDSSDAPSTAAATSAPATTEASPETSDTTDGAAGATTSAAAPTKSEIKVGQIVTLSGPQASSTSQAATVAEAWVAWKNDNGGINGHPVVLISEDDAENPATAQAVAQKLVEQDDVLAIVGVTDNLIGAWGQYVSEQGVAVIGGPTNQTPWYELPGLFGLPTDVISGLNSQVAVAKEYGKATKFANVYCAEVAACAQADAPLKAAADAAGIQYTSLAITATTPTYTAECLRLQQEGADYVQLNFAAATALRLVKDCQAQGYNPTFGSSLQSYGPEYDELPDFTVFGPAYAFNYTDGSEHAQLFLDVMDEYANGERWQGGPGTWAWDGFQAFAAALEDVGDNPTREDVFTAIYALKGDLDGELANPMDFKEGQPNAFGGKPCYFVMGVANSELIAPAGAEANCPSA